MASGNVVLAACSLQTYTDGVQLYPAVEDLASDNTESVVATVDGTPVANDLDGGTESTLGTLTLNEVPASEPGLAIGDSVVVRQFGAGDQPTITALMEGGVIYLIFLTRPGEHGVLASQVFVTGSNEGIDVIANANLAQEEMVCMQVDATEGGDIAASTYRRRGEGSDRTQRVASSERRTRRLNPTPG